MTGARIALVLALAPAALSAQAADDSLRVLARTLTAQELALEVRGRPLPARAAVGDALTDGDLDMARRLAAAFAVAWADSFLVREVERFAGWPADRRAAKIRADSLRREGIAAYGRDGAHAAVVIWRDALAASAAVADSAGMAATLGNLGAGFLAMDALDSAAVRLDAARSLAARIGHLQVRANALRLLGDLALDRGDLAGAAARYADAMALHQRIGDSGGVAGGHNALGLLAWETGDLREARARFEAALRIHRGDRRHDAAAAVMVNLAGLAALDGDFSRAERMYRDAHATWAAAGLWADAADALLGLGQLELRRGHYPAAADALAAALEIYKRTGPLSSLLAARRALAAAHAARGSIQDAVDELRRAQAAADSAGGGPAVLAGLALARADLAVQLNDLADADRLYADGERLYRSAGDPAGRAAAQHGRGLLLLARGDVRGARSVLETAFRTQQAAGHARAAALVRLALADAALADGDPDGAAGQLEQAAAELAALGDPVGMAAALGEGAALEARRGALSAADSLYAAALAALGDRPVPDLAWRLHAGLADLRAAQGRPDQAARHLRVAIARIEEAGASLALPERRAGYMADKWSVYASLAMVEWRLGRPVAAFEASERLRARETLERTARGRVAVAPDPSGELVAREQDLRRRISELTAGLASAAGTTVRGPELELAALESRQALLDAQRRYAELMVDLRERAPRHDALVAPRTAEWRDVARRLRPGEAFIEYLVGDSGSVAFLVVSDGLAVVELGVARRELARLVEFARGTLDAPRPAAGAVWQAPLARLHARLIAPVQETGMLDGVSRLLVVPHQELHTLPFAALMDPEGRHLVERYAVAVTPSASLWVTLGDRRPARPGEGVLALAPRPDALPGSAREVDAVARAWGDDATVLAHGQATEARFRQEAPRRRILHLATFGVLNRHNPMFSFVELAPDGEHDGVLEVHEVFGLELAAELVVLSACRTGLGSGRTADVPAGDDWIGLAGAFLHAGAGAVVAALWAVEDQATALLMERFHRSLADGLDPTLALAAAQRSFLGTTSTAHPYRWAGFVAVDGGGRE